MLFIALSLWAHKYNKSSFLNKKKIGVNGECKYFQGESFFLRE